MTLALAAMIVRDQHFTGTGNDNLVALAVGDVTHGRREAHRTVRFCFDARRDRRTRCCTTDVEGTHRQLRARLTDRLRRDYTNCLARVDQRATTKITAIALATQTIACVASQRRTNFDFVDTQTLDIFNRIFIQQSAGFVLRFLCFWIDDVISSDPTENPITQRFDHFTTFNQCLH